jgi:hypothetical protein
MNTNALIVAIAQLVMDILARHQVSPSELTLEQVQDLIVAEIAAGRNETLAWFVLRGRVPPA